MTEEPVRLKHNRELSAAYIASSGIKHRYPKISDQIETLPIERWKLKPNGYNPTIIDAGASMLMAYRYHEQDFGTKLAIARINNDGDVLNAWELPIYGADSAEDPKWFMQGKLLCLSWVQSKFPREIRAIVKHGTFSETFMSQIVQPRVGRNDWTAIEKNWVFWGQDDSLFCLYQCQPSHKVFLLEGTETLETFDTPSPTWPYGNIRGGTSPIEYEGKWLRFFHSQHTKEPSKPNHRYFVGAYLMERQPPFKVLAVSRKPILYASEIDDFSPEQRTTCFHFKPNVVFPGGATIRDGYWLLSLGVNDCECVIAKIRPGQLQF